jgi:hypothetical protein
MTDYGWSERCDQVLAEIVADVPEPRWSLRSFFGQWQRPRLGLADLSPDWWSRRSRPARTSVRSQLSVPRAAVARQTVALSAGARAAILRELGEWDGREQGGALAGWIKDGRIVVEYAGGLGVGVPVKRGPTWVKPPLARFHDFARACRCELVGEWHTHPGGKPTRASSDDERGWERVRAALETPAYFGLILAPRKSVALGLTRWQDEVVWSWQNADVGAYLVTEHGCKPVTLTWRST